MATYKELLSAAENPDLTLRIRVAVMIAAERIRSEAPGTDNHAWRMQWAQDAFKDPDSMIRSMMSTVLAQNVGMPVADIVKMSDEAVQGSVDKAINVFATGA